MATNRNTNSKTNRRTRRTTSTRRVVMEGHPRRSRRNKLGSIEMRNLNSEVIRDVEYRNGDLYVTMRNGAAYMYPRVSSEVIKEFLAADSFGTYFRNHIRNRRFVRLS